MGARPSTFKGGGGFLKNQKGTIVGYELTDHAFGEAKQVGKDGSFTPMHSTLSILLDGADAPITNNLFAGNAQDFEISDDGHTLTPAEEGNGPRKTAAWSQFIASLVDAGYDENQLPEEEINWEPIIGARCEFDQVTDESMVDKKTKKPLMRKDKKTGKEYPYTRTVVSEFLGMAEVGKGSKKAKPGKPVAAAAAPAKGAKGKKQAEDVSEQAIEALTRYLEAAEGNSLGLSKLRIKVITDKTFVNQPAEKEAVALMVTDVKWLGGLEEHSISFDAKAKTVTLG